MSEFVTIFRGEVNAQECDIMGHFNIQFYAAKVAKGLEHLLAEAGCLKTTRKSLHYSRAFSRYVGELHTGDALEVRAAVIGIGDHDLDLVAEIINGATGELSSSFDLHCCLCDPVTHAPLSWPTAARDYLTAMITEPPQRKRPPTAGTDAPALTARPADTFVSSRGTINAWDCDTHGNMCLRQYYAIASDGIGPLRHRMGITRDQAKTLAWGGAALEYAVQFLAPISAGDVYTLRTGLLHVADKTFRIGHRLHNDSSGELAATFDIVACMFDLHARRTMTIPGQVRAKAETMIIEWP